VCCSLLQCVAVCCCHVHELCMKMQEIYMWIVIFCLGACDYTHAHACTCYFHEYFHTFPWFTHLRVVSHEWRRHSLFINEACHACVSCIHAFWYVRTCPIHDILRIYIYIFIRDTTYSYVVGLIHTWHDSFINDMTRSEATWLIQTRHDSFIFVTAHSLVHANDQSHIWMSHVTHMNESCHTYESVMSHIWISHTWIIHVIHTNESCHTYEWFMLRIWMSRVTHIDVTV